MSEETRELTIRLSLPAENWARLEKYAENDGKPLQEYLDSYFNLGVATALREGYIQDAFNDKA